MRLLLKESLGLLCLCGPSDPPVEVVSELTDFSHEAMQIDCPPGFELTAHSPVYSVVHDLCSDGTTGASCMKLMRNVHDGELVATKWLPRSEGHALERQLEREIINHRHLRHPNIVAFREVFTSCSWSSSSNQTTIRMPVISFYMITTGYWNFYFFEWCHELVVLAKQP